MNRGMFSLILVFWTMYECARNEMIYGLPWMEIIGHFCGNSNMIYTHDCVIREYHWRMALLVTQIVIQANPYISHMH